MPNCKQSMPRLPLVKPMKSGTMSHEQQIQLFEDKKVRTIWDSEQEKWYFSIVDVVQVLTDSAEMHATIGKYSRTAFSKNRLQKEGNETVTNCNQLKMQVSVLRHRLKNVCCELTTTCSQLTLQAIVGKIRNCELVTNCNQLKLRIAEWTETVTNCHTLGLQEANESVTTCNALSIHQKRMRSALRIATLPI